jgi:hypothetical protein
VHQPGAANTSTVAAFPQRNYDFAAAGAWSQRLEVQAFAVPTGQDGFSPDQARRFAPTPRAFLFGVSAPTGTAPICGADRPACRRRWM